MRMHSTSQAIKLKQAMERITVALCVGLVVAMAVGVL